jgi:hypothetical protein
MTNKETIKQVEQAIDALYKVETMEIMQEEIPTTEAFKYTNLAEIVGVSGAIDKLNNLLTSNMDIILEQIKKGGK